MPLRRLALILIALLVLGEAGLAVWRFMPVEPSTAPVFSFPPAVENFDKSGNLASTIEVYGADRGAEWGHTAADGTQLTVFYFEWDAYHIKPIMDIAIHAPETCNTKLGYQLKEIAVKRTHAVPGQYPLVFDSTRFVDPAGHSVYMFKMVWFQGRGSMAFREMGFNRIERIKTSLLPHTGAARVLQAGVFNAQDADHAWQTFRTEVLDHLEWR